MENNNNVLEIRGLNSYFFTEKGVAPAVDGLDLDIPKGKIIGLVGGERLRQKHDRQIHYGPAEIPPAAWRAAASGLKIRT